MGEEEQATSVNAEKNLGAMSEDRETVQGWQAIETAPKDGSWQVVARFNAEGKRLWWERAVYSLKHDLWKTYGGYCDPTHYVPLPDPPEVKE